jgi:MYXO-CTERM domain-containing protein
VRLLVGAACALGVLAAAPAARANSRLPAANQLVAAPDDPASLLLRTTFGMLFTRDAGATWDWLCEDAIPVSGQQDPAVALLAGGVVLSGEIEGLAESPDHGCSWSFVSGTAKTLAVDVARSPDGATAIAATNKYVGTSDAGVLLYDSRVLQTVDAGKTWQALPGAIDPTLVLDTIELAASDPKRIYVTGQAFGAPEFAMLVSRDTGQSYQAYAVPFAPGETGAYIAGVDPNDADRVYVRTLGTSDAGIQQFSRLLVSKDGGQTFTEAWTGDKLLGFALSKDGSRVYVGTALAGLLAANASDLVFSRRSPLQVYCLGTSGDVLYVCASEPNALTVTGNPFIVGSTTDEGATFAPLLRLETVHAPLDCAAGSSASICATEWPALVQQLGIDAGAEPAPDAGGGGGCGCESSEPTPGGALVAGALVALFFTLRNRLFRAAR